MASLHRITQTPSPSFQPGRACLSTKRVVIPRIVSGVCDKQTAPRCSSGAPTLENSVPEPSTGGDPPPARPNQRGADNGGGGDDSNKKKQDVTGQGWVPIIVPLLMSICAVVLTGVITYFLGWTPPRSLRDSASRFEAGLGAAGRGVGVVEMPEDSGSALPSGFERAAAAHGRCIQEGVKDAAREHKWGMFGVGTGIFGGLVALALATYYSQPGSR